MIERVPGSPHLLLTGFHIVSDPNDADMLEKRVPESLRPLADKLQAAAVKQKRNAVADIKEAIHKYPKFPAFKNFLFTYYSYTDNMRAGREVAEQMFAEHPEYLYARMNLAEALLHANELARIPKILGKTLNLKMLYPQRERFLLGELIAYQRIAVLYLIQKGDIKVAETHLEAMHKSKLMPRHLLESLNEALLAARVKKQSEAMAQRTEQPQWVPNEGDKLESEVLKHFNLQSTEPSSDQPEQKIGKPVVKNVNQNDPCPCGSGKKYKRCCGNV